MERHVLFSVLLLIVFMEHALELDVHAILMQHMDIGLDRRVRCANRSTLVPVARSFATVAVVFMANAMRMVIACVILTLYMVIGLVHLAMFVRSTIMV